MHSNILTALSGLILPLAGYAMPAANGNTYQRSYLAAAQQTPTADLALHNRPVKSKAKPIANTTEDELQLVQANPVQELIIIDSAVPDKAVLYKAARPGTAIIELTADTDGLQQLSAILQQYRGLTALHLVSHAEQGVLLLGNSRIDAALLQQELNLFNALNGALTAGADLLLYGCNLAKGETGAEFLDILQTNTQADLAASNNFTGNPEQGGDWQLEIQRGQVESPLAFSEKALRDYSDVLAASDGTKTFAGWAGNNTAELSTADFRMTARDGNNNARNVGIYGGSIGYMATGAGNANHYLYVRADGTNTTAFELTGLSSGEAPGYGHNFANIRIVGMVQGGGTVNSSTIAGTAAFDESFTFGGGQLTAFSGVKLTGFKLYFDCGTSCDQLADVALFEFRSFTIQGATNTTPPAVTDGNISISGASGTGGAYKIGDTISATWNNTAGGDNNAGITGVTADFSQFGGGAAVAATNSAGTWTATYTIPAGAIDTTNRNISITATNADGPTTTADTSNATVDNVAPTVTDARISISGGTGSGGTYIVGDSVTASWNNTAGGDNNSDTISSVTVNFSQFGGGTVAASNSAGTWTATYTVVAGAIEAGSRNISVTATDNAGNSTTRADTSNAAVDNAAPVVGSVSVPANATYIAGQNLDFVVNIASASDVVVDTNGGTPRIALTVGASTRYASYVSGSASPWLTFRYTVQPGDFDANGIAVAGVIDANSGTLQDGSGNNMDLTLNSVGSTASVLVDGITVPDAPTIGTATAGNAQASVTFTAPGNNGGSAITTYTATASPGGASGNCAGPAACTISVNGLDNGTSYSFTVTATNIKGNSVASAPSNAVIPKANQTITFNNPGAQNFGTTPTLTATSSAGIGYSVSFTSSTTGVCTITTGGTLTFVTAGSCTIDADQPGDATTNAATTVSQTFTVNAVVPGAPTLAAATAGDTQASVTFTAPANTGGTAVTGYTVTSNPGGFTGTGAGSPISVTGLTNGVAYTFTVTATNSAGTGAASAASNAITPASPQTITFNNPGTQNFGTTPTLTATSSAGAGYTVTFTSSTTSVCTITAGGTLAFGTAGSCTINADQAGDSSFLAAPQVSQTFTVNPVVPGTPTDVVATAGDTTASIAFTAPGSNGGVNITGYTVTSNPGGLAASGAGSPIVVSGLTNGTAYTFTVTATNSAGTGAASAASAIVTPTSAQTITFTNPGAQSFGATPTLTAEASSGLPVSFTSSTTAVCNITGGGTLSFNTVGSCTINANQPGNATFQPANTVSHTFTVNAVVPGAPTAVAATIGDTTAAVAFVAPTFNGGASITNYIVTSSPGGLTASGTSSPVTVSGLTNGTSYTFSAVAINPVGSSTPSAPSNVIVPVANQSITFADPGSQAFGSTPTLAATASSGLAVTFSSSTADVCSVSSSGTLAFVTIGTCIISADQSGDAAYLAAPQVNRSFSVTAVVPAAPTIGAATALSGTEVSVTFSAPAFTGGSEITSYTVTSAPDNLSASGNGSPITVTGLSGGKAYTFTVTATNSAGISVASAVSNSITLNSAPEISGTPPTQVSRGNTYLFTPVTTDAENDSLTFSIGNKPAWASFSTTTGELSGTPTRDDVGTTTGIVISVSDGEFSAGLSAFNIEVTAVNDAPEISGTPLTSVNQDETYSFTPTASDPDDDTLTFSIENKPTWVSFDTATGALTGTPAKEHVGTTSGIVISVSDGEYNAALSAFNLTVVNVNETPVISGTPVTSVNEDEAYSFVPTASDPDDDTLTFSITNQPTWASFDTATGALTGTPGKEHVGTTNGIVIGVSDGEFTTSLAAFNLEVINVNAAPVAANDNIELPFSANHTYLLDVAANDTDPDDDSLTITAAKAGIGLVSVQSNKLLFTAPDNFSGTASFSYSISDGELSDMAQVTLQIAGSNPDAPVITAPDDLIINATGLFTKVDVGVATAVDVAGNRLAVSLVNGLPMFAAGSHELYWRATDASGLSSTVTQLLQVNPLVSLSKPQTVINNSTVTVEVILNGQAPVYPLQVAYTVSGSADALTEHDLAAGSVQISSGLRASFSFNLFADLTSVAEKDIVITLDNGLNLGANASTSISVTEANLAPVVVLDAQQQGENRLTLSKAGGVASITAQVNDPNPGDSTGLQWQADAALSNISGDAMQFVFDPAGLASGVYRIALTATDDAAVPLNSTAEIYLLVQNSLPLLDDSDSNNNLIPDQAEGFGDSNSNGIADYLDPGFDCNVIPEQLANVVQFVAEGEPGICLRKGTTAAMSNSGGIQLTTADQQALEPDMLATNIGGSFDFMLHSLPVAGAGYRLVLPQRQPVPQNAVYRKFTQTNGWSNFVQNERNQLFSAAGEPGFCPPPGDNSWQNGLTAGHWCVQLLIEDGGANDADGLANSTIVDPGGVAVILNGNQLPVAADDSYSVQWNQSHALDVLQNDTDADGDTLSINQASAAFGSVSISDDGLTLLYTPAQDFVGTDTLSYGINDGNNGSAGATVSVAVYYNRAPLVTNATADTNDQTAIDIDVLANASDPDGDALTVSSASAQTGTVSITAAQTLRYTPQPGFSGTDTVSFTVSDNRGGSVNGEVLISVSAYEVITVVNKSSGGAVNGWPLLLLACLVMLRQRQMLLKALLMLVATLSFSASANWSVDAFFGKSTTKQSTTEIHSQLPAETELLQYDNSGRSWALGLSYYFTPRLAIQAHYVDLGDASVSMRGETLTAEAFHRSVSDIGPMLAKGVRSGLAYHVWQHAGWSATVQAGVFAWNSETRSTAGDNLIGYKASDTDIYWALGAGYALDQHLTLRTTFTRYHLEGNKADNIMLGVSYNF